MLSGSRLCGAALVAVLFFAGAAWGNEKIHTSGIYTPPADSPQNFAEGWENNISGFEGYAGMPEAFISQAPPLQAVPEPSTLVLFAAGISAARAVRRRMNLR